jgi:hypothetical protein
LIYLGAEKLATSLDHLCNLYVNGFLDSGGANHRIDPGDCIGHLNKGF